MEHQRSVAGLSGCLSPSSSRPRSIWNSHADETVHMGSRTSLRARLLSPVATHVHRVLSFQYAFLLLSGPHVPRDRQPPLSSPLGKSGTKFPHRTPLAWVVATLSLSYFHAGGSLKSRCRFGKVPSTVGYCGIYLRGSSSAVRETHRRRSPEASANASKLAWLRDGYIPGIRTGASSVGHYRETHKKAWTLVIKSVVRDLRVGALARRGSSPGVGRFVVSVKHHSMPQIWPDSSLGRISCTPNLAPFRTRRPTTIA
ncbi:hypothetical protein FPV67DRAFT_1202311 [Lyophyllum atratum]|nr:hypothetical protein FPV67DRAFT_1202311 [Lyophyllum atratum]